MKAALKRAFLPQGRKLRRLRGGIAAGSFMSLDVNHQLQRYLGLDERELLLELRRRIPLANTLVDVGANDGLYTMHFLASNAECVIACEPGPIREQLAANAAANGWRGPPRFRLETRLVGTCSDCVMLAELLVNCPQPIFVKVDVDGAELDVLHSGEEFAQLNQVSWVVETHSLELENSCKEWFSKHHYTIKIIQPAWWRAIIPERRPLEHNRWLVAEPHG